MIKLIVIVLMAFARMEVMVHDPSRSQLEGVSSVDLGRYAGRWYEIARLPNRFEKKCADSVTATYTLRTDGKIEVVNRCRKSSGGIHRGEGQGEDRR